MKYDFVRYMAKSCKVCLRLWFLLFAIVFIVCLQNILKHSQQSNRRMKLFLRDTATCSPARNVAYLKTHKTGSSFVQGILFRYGLKNDLHFAVPEFGNYFGLGKVFDAAMISPRVNGGFPLNIFAIHTRWNFDELKSLMPNDTIYISSVRDPVAQFESLFVYAEFEKVTGLNLHEYVFYTPVNGKRLNNYLGFNQMLFDFGMPEENFYNTDDVKDFILNADKQFDLVLVAEKMEQSLILLRHLLCWNIEDMIGFKINARKQEFKRKLNPETEELLKERLVPDQQLYDYFDNKLDSLIERFGKDKMKDEVKEMRIATEELKEKCNLEEAKLSELKSGFNKPFSRMVNGMKGNLNDSTCELFILDELVVVDRIRRKQIKEVMRKYNYNPPFKAPLFGIPLSDANPNDIIKLFMRKTKPDKGLTIHP